MQARRVGTAVFGVHDRRGAVRDMGMRMIGHLGNEAHARLFSDYLYAQGVENDVEPDRDGAWAVWVHAEEELEHATRQLQHFLRQPGDEKYQHAQELAQDRRAQHRKEEEAAQERHFDRDKLMPKRIYGIGMLTLGLIGLSVVLSLLFWAELNLSWLSISEYDVREGGAPARIQHGLPEVRSGQVWRIFTPILLHGGILHLLFNMLWLKDLGTMYESGLGTRRYLVFVLVIAGLSNLGQFILSGPNFVGMSGVVYGLLGYIWIRGRFDPRSGFFVDRNTMLLMTVWFFACLVGIIPHVANTVHTVGFVGGLLWGYLAALRATAG
jgi:GlpG protein